MIQISTIRELVGLWPTRADLAADLAAQNPARGVTVHQVHKWAEKGSIPARYHLQVLRAAQARDLPVTAELIVCLHGQSEAAA